MREKAKKTLWSRVVIIHFSRLLAESTHEDVCRWSIWKSIRYVSVVSGMDDDPRIVYRR